MPRALRLVALAAAVALGAWVAARLTAGGPADADAIRELLARGARAADEGRPDEAVLPLSRRFHGEEVAGPRLEPLDREGVRRLVALESARVQGTLVALAGADVHVDGDGARAVADLVLARGAAGRSPRELRPDEGTALRVRCELQREEGQWRVTSARWRTVPIAEALAGEAARAAELRVLR